MNKEEKIKHNNEIKRQKYKARSLPKHNNKYRIKIPTLKSCKKWLQLYRKSSKYLNKFYSSQLISVHNTSILISNYQATIVQLQSNIIHEYTSQEHTITSSTTSLDVNLPLHLLQTQTRINYYRNQIATLNDKLDTIFSSAKLHFFKEPPKLQKNIS